MAETVATTRRKTKYAAVGDSVRIVVPRQFIRCGYPLSIKMVMERDFAEIEKDFERMFAALENRPVPTPEPAPPTFGPSDWLADLKVTPVSSCSATVHGMICAAIAAYRLEKENFGGAVRQVMEGGPGPLVKGEVWKVVGKNFVRTGKRCPSHSYQSSYTGEWDYEPGGLENAQTHCVYSMERYGNKVKILAAHCEVVTGE